MNPRIQVTPKVCHGKPVIRGQAWDEGAGGTFHVAAITGRRYLNESR